MKTFSLIVATLGRVEELDRLLTSLEKQSLTDFEVIVVDQNTDDRLAAVLHRHGTLAIQRIRTEPGGSRARNLGIKAASGTLIAFPDDDCWYPDNLLAQLRDWFDRHPDFSGLFACLKDADHKPVGPRRPPESCVCSKYNLLCLALTPGGFLRKSVVDQVGFFNEAIGVGAKSAYQSGEDLDYFLRVCELGGFLWYEAALTVHHPSFHSPERLRRTSYVYALGGAYVMRIHGFSLWSFLQWLARPLGGALVSCMEGDFENARIYLARAAGQCRGFFWGPREQQRNVQTQQVP